MENNLIIKLILIFIAGFIIDLIITKYTSAVAEKKIWMATIFSGLITIANFTFITMLLRDSIYDSIISIGVFAAGNCFGTYYIMKRWLNNHGEKKESSVSNLRKKEETH